MFYSQFHFLYFWHSFNCEWKSQTNEYHGYLRYPINVILNIILIPQFHAFGSAIASVTTQFMTALIQVFIAVKIFKFKTNKRLLIALVFFIFGVACINYLSFHLTKQWMLNFAIMVAASGLWAFVTGIINIKSVLRFIKYK